MDAAPNQQQPGMTNGGTPLGTPTNPVGISPTPRPAAPMMPNPVSPAARDAALRTLGTDPAAVSAPAATPKSAAPAAGQSYGDVWDQLQAQERPPSSNMAG